LQIHRDRMTMATRKSRRSIRLVIAEKDIDARGRLHSSRRFLFQRDSHDCNQKRKEETGLGHVDNSVLRMLSR
jgi:hypothetical protein